MSEVPASHNSHDSDPFRDTLRQIHDRYMRLALLDKNTSYSRNHSLQINGLQDPIELRTTSTGDLGNTLSSNIFLDFPSPDKDSFGNTAYSGFFAAQVADITQAGLLFRPDATITPQQELATWYERDDVSENLTRIFANMAFIQMDFERDDSSRDITKEVYDGIWNSVHAELNNARPAASTVAHWEPDGPFKTLNGEDIFNVSAKYEFNRDTGDQLQYADIVTNNFELSISRDEETDALSYRFIDYNNPAALPELTDAEKRLHPYIAIPVADMQPTLQEGEQVFAYRAEGFESLEVQYKDGYAVVKVHVATSETVSTTTSFFDTLEEAQEHADNTYKEELAEKRGVYNLTQNRAEKVLHTLDNLLTLYELKQKNEPPAAL